MTERLAEDVDPDTAIVAADVLSRQALDAQAEDLALEDTLYSLNKALQEGVIPSESYMKQVRPFRHGLRCGASLSYPFCQFLESAAISWSPYIFNMLSEANLSSLQCCFQETAS